MFRKAATFLKAVLLLLVVTSLQVAMLPQAAMVRQALMLHPALTLCLVESCTERLINVKSAKDYTITLETATLVFEYIKTR